MHEFMHCVGEDCLPDGAFTVNYCCRHTGLKERVTDSGLSALASAGCGTKLTSLILEGDKLWLA